MKELEYKKIVDEVARLCIESNCLIEPDVHNALKKSVELEESPAGKEVLKQILENIEIAKKEMLPACQDTGAAVVFVELGSGVRISGGELPAAINDGVRKGYTEGYLRKSILSDPFKRVNTKDNTPAFITFDIVPGDNLKITVVPKGGGSENMSTIKMFPPSAGPEGVSDFVVDWVLKSGANPCPPIIVGVGIGGTFDRCALIAKKALLREIGSTHPDPFYADMEKELLTRINKLGIGPQGFGGRVTALAVFIETAPCHIASLPAAVNINCHVARHRSVTL